MNAGHEIPIVRTEFKKVSDAEIRPETCVACGDGKIKRRGHQFHDMQDMGTTTVKRILRHEKITWECKTCGAQFMLVHPGVPHDTEYTDDVKEYVFKRVLDKGDAMNRVAADLRDLHHVEITVQGIGKWIKKEQAKGEASTADEGGHPPPPQPAPVLTLDGTFKAARSKKNTGGPDMASEPSCLHLTRLKDGRLAAFWLLGSERKR
jgi:ribosomal protein L37AE/L43A